jgi:CheY-like chemotaxis protein
MQQLGGTIEVDSALGVGTTLTLLCQRSMLEASSSDRFPRGTAAPVERDRTVLLVEDVAVLREAIMTLLEEAGYRVIAAADGRQAHQLSEREQGTIDLLVTDVVLPQMNGYRLAEVLRAARPALSVLYLSGYDRPRGLDEALRSPRTAFASKPFAPETLLATLARLLP